MRTTTRGRFRVGDWVSFLYGTGDMFAQVIEERGPLGIGRTHVYRLCVPGGDGERDSFELPEDRLEAVPPPSREATIEYLKKGGLVEILRSNLGSGEDPPKAWLTYTPDGKISHTFTADRGVIGGATVPYFALHEKYVFTGKKEAVVRFLASFGLNRTEAEAVVAAVGTAP